MTLDEWLPQVNGNAPGYSNLKNYLGGLQSQYGLSTDDFTKALQNQGYSYNATGPEMGPDGEMYGGTKGFLDDKNIGWQGEQSLIKSIGSGLDSLNPNAAYKGSWNSLWNQNAQNAGQNELSTIYDANPDKLNTDWSELGNILKGVGLVTGVGALGGAFAGLGGAAAGGGAAAAEGGMSLAPSAFEGLSSSLIPAGASAVPTGLAAVGGGAAIPASSGILGALSGAAAGGLAGASNGWTSGADLPTGTAATNTGANNVSWLDDLLNNTGGNFDTGGLQASDQSAIDFANQLNDVNGLPSGPSGLDVPGGTNAVNAGGTNGGQGIWNQITSALSGGNTNGATSLLKSALGLNDSQASSFASMLGKLGAAGFGAYASNQQSNALADVAKQYAGYGAPYRDQLAQLQSNPGSFLTSPRVTSSVDQGTSALARALSVKNGNPIGSGNALQELQNYSTNNLYGQLTNRENQLANFGGLSSFNAAAPQTGLASVQAQGNTYNAIGAGLNDVLNPQPTYLDIIKAMKGGLA